MFTAFKKCACIFCSLIFLSSTIIAQTGPAIQWQKCLGGSLNDYANDLILTADGGFIIVGFSFSNNANVSGHHGSTDSSDAWVAKLNASGNIIWQRSIGGTRNDQFKSIIALNDSTYICGGSTYSNNGDVTGNNGGQDVWLVTINKNGDLLNSFCFGGTGSDDLRNLIKLADGKIAVAAYTNSVDGELTGLRPHPNGENIWLFKTDINGNFNWNKCYGNWATDGVSDLIQINSLEIIAGVHPGSDGGDGPIPVGDGNDDYTLKINQATGAIISMDRVLINRFTSNGSLSKTNNGFIYARSGTYAPLCTPKFMINAAVPVTLTGICNDMGGPNEFLSKWFESPHGILSLNDTAFIGVGSMYHSNGPVDLNYGMADAYIGFVPFATYSDKNYGGSNNDYFKAIKVLPSGNEFIVVGYTNSNDNQVSGNHGGYDCWIVKLAGSNIISGRVFIDANNNNLYDAGEADFKKAIISSKKQGFSMASVPQQGFYANPVDTGTFNTSIQIQHPYFTATPTNANSIFNTYKNNDTINFAVHPIPGIRDLAVNIISTDIARPGFDFNYHIYFNNNGTDTATNIKLRFIKDSRLILQSATPVQSSISGDTLIWNLATMPPGFSEIINIKFTVPIIPIVQLGNQLFASAMIDSSGDATPADNLALLVNTVSGSYDPNDKKENHGGSITLKELAADKYLTYTIRFQNSGTDTAFNINIRDTLDNKLDWSSFQMIASSHPCQTTLKQGNKINWYFKDIKLVDSFHNESLSHGFISYKIKTLSSLNIGQQVNNSASIYFDFNPAIKTNTQITLVKSIEAKWTGAINNNWHYAGNWENGKVPDDFTDVKIEAGKPIYPVVNSNALCRSILVQTGASVTVSTGAELKVLH